MGGYDADHEIPIITRAEGCYVYDEHGNRYLDGLSGLFCVNAGHGRTEYGEAAARQVEELDFYTLWSYAHPRAIELAARIASLAPGDLNRVFFTYGGARGGRVGAEAGPQLPPHARQRPEAQGDRPRGRLPRHHAGGALGDRHHRAAHPVRTARPRAAATSPTPTSTAGPRSASRLWAADAIEERIVFEGPETRRRGDPRAGPERRRLLRPARRLLPAGARDLRPLRRADDLRRGDLRLGPARPLLRLRTLRLPAGHRSPSPRR